MHLGCVMKIAESTVLLAAQRSYQEEHRTALNIRVEQRASVPVSRTQVDISDAGKATSAAEVDLEKEIDNNPRLRLIIRMIEMLTGREFKLTHLKLQNPNQTTSNIQDPPSSSPAEAQRGFAIDYSEVHAENEAVSFQAAGVIKTSDGREISFKAELNMERNYREESSFQLASGSPARQAKDPLILNYDAPAATLSDQTFAFDLDTDGEKDQISLLNRGSAFLALDSNGDGQINNGKELFGTQNGDGFADLAQHDSDHNGWIDENDMIFAKLKLWIKDASGTDKLLDLKSMGIGAIYLGKASADFSLNNASNQELGRSRATGVYLNENGSGGTLQQIDLVA